jgi:hypothetical protein
LGARDGSPSGGGDAAAAAILHLHERDRVPSPDDVPEGARVGGGVEELPVVVIAQRLRQRDVVRDGVVGERVEGEDGAPEVGQATVEPRSATALVNSRASFSGAEEERVPVPVPRSMRLPWDATTRGSEANAASGQWMQR